MLLSRQYFHVSFKKTILYFFTLTVAFHDSMSLFGFFTFLIIANQLISGTMLSFSLVPEPMMIPLVRDEEDLEDLYIDDFFWLHERGVDLLFIFVFFHLLRKLYMSNIDYEQEFAWKSGAFSFLIIQGVVFFGLVLCCTHLSEITLTIAANALHTFFFFKGKAYWWLFTDRLLNTDTMLRLAYAHYLLAFFLAFLGVVHGIDMHYDWKTESSFDGIKQEMMWWDEALSNELGKTIDILAIIAFCCFLLYEEPEALSYEIFMWGDVGMSTDVRFYGVAPHWYFRPYMAWLIVCPHHRPGIFGLVYFFLIIFYQPNIHGVNESSSYKNNINFFDASSRYYAPKLSRILVEADLWHQTFYALFIMAVAYSTTFLPYGRFYNRLGGNNGMLLAYLYIFLYLGIPNLKKNYSYTYFKLFIYSLISPFKKEATI